MRYSLKLLLEWPQINKYKKSAKHFLTQSLSLGCDPESNAMQAYISMYHKKRSLILYSAWNFENSGLIKSYLRLLWELVGWFFARHLFLGVLKMFFEG